MNETTKEALNRPEIWKRGLFMVLFAVLYGVAEVVLSVVVFVQFLVVLFTGSANQQLLRLGSSAAQYCYQIYQFLTFNSDEQPFPMADWPAHDAYDSPWFEDDSTEAYRPAEPEPEPEPEVERETDRADEIEETEEPEQAEESAADVADSEDSASQSGSEAPKS